MAGAVTLDFAGFRSEVVDKVMRLLVLLDRVWKHPVLCRKVCLHGGTALNLFVLGAPRLSVDIDLDYLNRSPLLPVTVETLRTNTGVSIMFPLQSTIELFAGKTKALLDRVAVRDLQHRGRLSRVARGGGCPPIATRHALLPVDGWPVPQAFRGRTPIRGTRERCDAGPPPGVARARPAWP
jgi:hypothetical protein